MLRRIALCLAAAAASGILAVGLLGAGAAADPSGQPTMAGSEPPTLYSATTGAGTTVEIDVVIDFELLHPGNDVPKSLPALPAGEVYLEVRLESAPADAPDLPVVFPIGAASLRTNGGTVSASRGSTASNWYFSVPASTSVAILTDSTTTAYLPILGPDGKVTTRAAHPSVIGLLLTPHVPGAASAPSPHPNAHPANPAAKALALGSGGIVVVAGAGGLLAFGRRRAFYRADRAGRVVLVAPPVVAGQVEQLEPEAPAPPALERIVVRILGWLQITRARAGSEQAIAASGPVSEIVVFLVLHPGRSFTSIQLREAIWCLGRSPLSSATFRKYMVELRKAFGTGVVVTRRYRYELTAAVVSDLAVFRSALRREDGLAGPEEALELVRGPVLNGCFDGKKNSPFAWAVGAANDIEDEVTSVAHDLAVACLAAAQPTRAARALAQGLLCSATNLRLRLLELEVGAVGGAGELSRRLAAGRAALAGFPEDVVRLEEAARQLGGEALRS